MGWHIGKRYIYLWHCFHAKNGAENDLHIPNRVNANIVKSLDSIFTKNLALCAGNCRLAESVAPEGSCLVTPGLTEHSYSVTGSVVVKDLFCSCMINIFNNGDSPFCLGNRKERLKHCLSPQTFFPSAKKYCPFVPFCYQRIILTWVQSDVVHLKILKGHQTSLPISLLMTWGLELWFQIHQFSASNDH